MSLKKGKLEDEIVFESRIFSSVGNSSKRDSKLSLASVNSSVSQVALLTKPIDLKSKRSSFEIIMNVSNIVMGTYMLVFPLNFYKSGVFSSIISALIIGLLSYKTTLLMLKHLREDEGDYTISLTRIMGKSWNTSFKVTAGIFTFFNGVFHFSLMTDVLYALLRIIFDNFSWPSTQVIDFNNGFSSQFCGFLSFGFCILVYLVEEPRNIFKVNDKGWWIIMLFNILLIYLGIKALVVSDINFPIYGSTMSDSSVKSNIFLFSIDIKTLVGLYSASFMMQNFIAGVMKTSSHSRNNSRDISIVFILIFFIYILFGVFGSFAFSGLFQGIPNLKKLPNTILDLFTKENTFLSSWEYIMIGIMLGLVFLQILSCMPCFCLFTRRRFYTILRGDSHKITTKEFHLFNIVFNLACLAGQLVTTNISLFMGFVGGIAGLLLIYIFPIFTHLKCLYRNKMHIVNDFNDQLTVRSSEEKCNHKYREGRHKFIAYIFYFMFLSIGFAIMIAQIYNLLISISNSL